MKMCRWSRDYCTCSAGMMRSFGSDADEGPRGKFRVW